MSAMSDMSLAIRVVIERYAPIEGVNARSLKGLDGQVLDDFCQIVGAFSMDLRDEQERREQAVTQDDEDAQARIGTVT